MQTEGGLGERGTPRGLATDHQTGPQPHITSQFEPKSRASHGLLQLREKGDKRVGTEVCNGAWTGSRAYGLLFEDGGKRKRRGWESSSSDEDDDENETQSEDGDLGEGMAEGDDERAAEGGPRGLKARHGAEQPWLDLQPVDRGLAEAVTNAGIVEQQAGGAEDFAPLKVAIRNEEVVKRRREADFTLLHDDEDNHVDIDEDIDVDIDVDIEEHIDEDNDDRSLEIEIDLDDEEDDEENRVATDEFVDDGGNSDYARVNNNEGTLAESGVPSSERPATTEPAADIEAHEMSPHSLSLCALPCSVEGTPSMHAPTLSIPGPCVDQNGTENFRNTAMCAEIAQVAEIAQIAIRAPMATAAVNNNDRLSQAIMGNECVATIRSMLADFSLGTGFVPGSESTLPPALVCACQDDSARNTDIVAALLEHRADVNEAYRGDGFTPLMQSAKTGNLEMIGLLLEAGADVERVCKDGRSALFVAIEKGRIDMALRLLSSSSGPVDALRIDRGRTALMEAARRGQADVVKALVEHGADVDLVDDRHKTALMLSLEKGVSNKKLLKLLMSETSVNLADETGATPLEVAISKKLASASQILVDAQCELGEYNRKTVGTDQTRTCVPLIHAIVNNAGTLLVRKMLERGASAECAVDGKTALMHAAELGDSQVVSDLIKAGADPLKEHGAGMTALMWAARMGHKSVSRMLMTVMGIGQ